MLSRSDRVRFCFAGLKGLLRLSSISLLVAKVSRCELPGGAQGGGSSGRKTLHREIAEEKFSAIDS